MPLAAQPMAAAVGRQPQTTQAASKNEMEGSVGQTRARQLMPWGRFKHHLIRYGASAGALLAISLLIGVAGFHWLAGQSGMDALLNASMLLGGQGPIGVIEGTGGKLFASAYALYAGLVFIGAAALAFAPLLHRLVHRLHLEEAEGSGE